MTKKIKEDREDNSNFLWHKVSEGEKEEIKKGAKRIMDDFSKALEKVDSGGDFVFVDRDDFTRDEGNALRPDLEFKKIIFENAPKKNKNSILAEKGGWV